VAIKAWSSISPILPCAHCNFMLASRAGVVLHAGVGAQCAALGIAVLEGHCQRGRALQGRDRGGCASSAFFTHGQQGLPSITYYTTIETTQFLTTVCPALQLQKLTDKHIQLAEQLGADKAKDIRIV
jgi:hypothetical protein